MNNDPHLNKSDDELLKVIQFLEDVSTNIYGLLTREEICQTVCEAFRKFPTYTCSFQDVDLESGDMIMTHISISRRVVRGLEKLTSERFGKTRISIDHSPIYTQAVRNRTTGCGVVLEMLKDAFPNRGAAIITKLASLAGFRARGIVAPLIIDDRVVSVFGMSSPVVTGEMIPSVNAFVRHVAAAIELAEASAARRKAEENLRRSLEKTQMMLRTSNHRIRDNLQVITSLLDLQIRTMDDEQVRDILTQIRNRIRAIAIVHEGLYTTPDFRRVKLAGYIRNLTQNIYRTHGANPNRIVLQTDIADADMAVPQLIPFGLVLNELVTNALVHAFAGGREENCRIELCIEKRDGSIRAAVADNGTGIPDSIKPAAADTFGFQLINMLVKDQLRGSIAPVGTDGTSFILEFPYRA